jgi:hypothetical protein
MVRQSQSPKSIGEELIVDIDRYRADTSCEALAILVFDPTRRLDNPRGLEADLTRQDAGFRVKVVICS